MSDKGDEIKNVDLDSIETKAKKPRKQSGPSKKELQSAVERLESERKSLVVTQKQTEALTKGFFISVEVLSGISFTKVDPELKTGFDESLTNVFEVYGGQMGRYAPLINCSFAFLFLTIDAIQKTPKKKDRKNNSKVVSEIQENVKTPKN